MSFDRDVLKLLSRGQFTSMVAGRQQSKMVRAGKGPKPFETLEPMNPRS